MPLTHVRFSLSIRLSLAREGGSRIPPLIISLLQPSAMTALSSLIQGELLAYFGGYFIFCLPPTRTGSTRFYAVRVGRIPGIYMSW